MKRLFHIIYVLLAIVIIFAWFKVKELPMKEEIDSALYNSPVQADGTERKNFSFLYRGKTYEVEPLADYELWGLVVSKNNIGAWYNYYHDENSVNLKDICVVWGENIKNGVYREDNIRFKSGEWTCYYQWLGRLDAKFYADQLSNNHLLASSEAARKTIRALNVGDQVRLKGVLADYAERGTDWYRRTSLSREDSNSSARGGGACEIVFVDQIETIKQNHPYWNMLYDWKWRIIFIAVIANLLFSFFGYRFGRGFND